MINQEELNFSIIGTIHDEFDHYKDMMTALSSLIRNSSTDLELTEDDRLGLSLLIDYITEGQECVFEEAKEKVKKKPDYILARAEEILSHYHNFNRLFGDFDEIINGLRHVIKVFGQAFPDAPGLLEKFERIAVSAEEK